MKYDNNIEEIEPEKSKKERRRFYWKNLGVLWGKSALFALIDTIPEEETSVGDYFKSLGIALGKGALTEVVDTIPEPEE